MIEILLILGWGVFKLLEYINNSLNAPSVWTTLFQCRCYMVSTLHHCLYDNSTISPVDKLKWIWRFSPFFPSFTFLSSTFLFNLFCFSSFIKESFYWIFWTLKWTQTAYFFTERERERELPKSSRERGGRVVRWCWVNFQCRGVLLIWIIVAQGPIALAVGAGGGCLEIFSLVYLSSFFFFFFSTFEDGPI